MRLKNYINEITKIETVHFDGFLHGAFAKSQPGGDLSKSRTIKFRDKPPKEWSSLIKQGYIWNKGNEWGFTTKGIELARKRVSDMKTTNPNKVKI